MVNLFGKLFGFSLPTKRKNALGWEPETGFADGIADTVTWYLENETWWRPVISGEYREYYRKMYGE